MKTSFRLGSLLFLAMAMLLANRSPLAQGGSGPHLYIADGAWDSEDCRLIRMDDLTGKNWTLFAPPQKGPQRFFDLNGLCIR